MKIPQQIEDLFHAAELMKLEQANQALGHISPMSYKEVRNILIASVPKIRDLIQEIHELNSDYDEVVDENEILLRKLSK